MQKIFLCCEELFRLKTGTFTTKLPCDDLVKKVLKDSFILSHYKSICTDVEPMVDKELSFNLLEQIVTLFFRVRTFSYAKDVREKHKVAKKKSRQHSLRTEIKKSGNNN